MPYVVDQKEYISSAPETVLHAHTTSCVSIVSPVQISHEIC